MNYKYVIGIDEAGRGPLAGPVAVGAVLFSKNEYKKFKFHLNGKFKSELNILKDSKKLSKNKREKWFKFMEEKQNFTQRLFFGKIKKDFRFLVVFSSAKIIDRRGINCAINTAIKKIFSKLSANEDECLILLDGALKAPSVFLNQKTIIKGDEKEPIISLASIVAKVKRDRKMISLSKKYPEYNFEKHKGYGVKAHYKMIKKYGICVLHRKSFLKNFLKKEI
ncbi:ribonuclease HII [Candidatus Campbellbacteria bacterium CG10_big_fil_rev_8_21_14_0_10_35_52]|uniref:Ribonuclease n=1 Tax=Candidatus Campbellbacteria bacterium CG10_big_fil_rev_8_21_14_0_10_35_52 TaxID=1974527 RepID=A0A2M6WW43_9BACT|nr:MAG: ribonuclease HII [Candidatus Campbellbacteria bacterium CG10_big_fil_rev_8_21_14_0_10_35_52]